MAVTERPYLLNYSKNEIRYVFQLSDLTRPNLFLQAQIFYAAIGSTDFTALPVMALLPDENGVIYLYIQDYLESLTDYVLPSFTSQFTNADDQCVQFYISFREIDDTNTNPVWDVSESDPYLIRYSLKGGIEKYKQSRNNFFINYFIPNKPFLTWMPSGRFVYADEELWLTFLNYKTIAGSGLRLIAAAVDTLGSSYSNPVDFTTDGFLFHVRADLTLFSAFTLPAGAKWYYYEISVEDADGNVLANAYRFYIEQRPIYTSYNLVYHNSVSGIDCVKVRGEVDEMIDRTFDEADGGMNVNDWNSDSKTYETFYSGIQKRNHYKGDIGWQKNQQQQKALTEILMSTSIYQHLQERWVPVINLQKSQDYGKTTDKIFSFPIEWALSEQDEVFTPAEINLGVGDTSDSPFPPACIPVAINKTVVSYRTVVDAPFAATINLTGTAPFVLSAVVCPSWMTAVLAGSQINLSGTPPDLDADGSTISFTVTNCFGATDSYEGRIIVGPASGGGFGVVLTRSGSTLTAVVTGGTGPFSYAYYCVATGTPCYSSSITNPNQSTSASSTSTPFSYTNYAGASYTFYCRVTDSLGNIVVSSGVEMPTCLVPATLIKMKDGSEKLLKNVVINDVLSDIDGKENIVTSATKHFVNKLFSINKGLLITSAGHVNICTNGALVCTEDLLVGDSLVDEEGKEIRIDTIDPQIGFELEVINISTTTRKYIANKILTHNKLACG